MCGALLRGFAFRGLSCFGLAQCGLALCRLALGFARCQPPGFGLARGGRLGSRLLHGALDVEPHLRIAPFGLPPGLQRFVGRTRLRGRLPLQGRRFVARRSCVGQVARAQRVQREVEVERSSSASITSGRLKRSRKRLTE